ncbi:restriction endonuclease subunit S [Anaerofustis stercorihominis]|uniref:restriction endonuclease subunit S n=1 Tax=Anaerofustis stercorihominis TaxID=214853 RepID=UPI001106116F|nr:restriction endonuclease subunit S [Anaerofustis stercorihominis]
MKVKLGDIATYINGYAFKPSDWKTQGIPIIRIQDLTGNSYQTNYYDGESIDKKYEVNEGDVLISWSASLGVYIWKGEKALLNQHIFKVVFDKIDIDKMYYIYALKFSLMKMKSFMHGATMKHIVKKDFDNITIPFPSLEEQSKIAGILQLVEGIIEKRKKQLEDLDELVKARFVEMFGDPVENPMGWEIGKIRDIVSDVRYGTSRPAVENGQYPYLRMNNITYNGELDLSDIKKIDIPENELEKCTVRFGDVLFNRTNSRELVGKTCVYNRNELMVLAGFIIRVRVNERMLPEFLSSFLNSDFSKKMLLNMCKTAIGQANINAQEMQNINIYIPPINVQETFVNFKLEVDNIKEKIQKSLDETQVLFDSLMQKYF